MDNPIDKILNEWAYRVSDGMPDPSDNYHQFQLEQYLNELRLPREVVKGVLEKVRKYKDNAQNKALGRVGKPWGSGEDEPSKDDKKGSDEKDVDTDTEELKQSLIDSKKIAADVDYKQRISNLEAKAEWELEGKEQQKQLEELSHLKEAIGTLDGSFKDRAAQLVTIGHFYEGRENSGMGKNMFGEVDRDQLVKNKETLIAGYDDAIPEEVEKYVRSARPNKVSEAFVKESFETLPQSLQDALMRKGKVGDAGKGKHFLGYKKSDGSLTSDVNDPGIKKDENGKPIAARGNTGTKARALVVWRIYLEQGGIDAYTGLPLDLEEMDLEHVVGFQNSDKGEPTPEDYLNREHEANQVLCSSKANQNKKDMSMKDFYESQVDPLKDKTPEEFQKMEKGFEEANEIVPVTEQTALRMMDEVSYELEGGGTTKNPDDPNVKKTDVGTPKAADATLGENVTSESIEAEFGLDDRKFKTVQTELLKAVTDSKDVKKIKNMKSKIGKRTVMAMGLPRGYPDPSGRRSIAVSGSDNFYRGFLKSMASVPFEDRQKFKDGWNEAIKLASSDEVRERAKTEKGHQQRVFIKHLRDNGLISDEILNDKKYGKLFR